MPNHKPLLMSRLKNDFLIRDTSSPPVWSNKQINLSLAVLVLLCFSPFFRPGSGPEEPAAQAAAPAVGKLSPWIVGDAARPQAGCQQAACEYLAVHPVSQMPTARALARYAGPPAQVLSAPAGYMFRPALHESLVYARSRSQNRHEFVLPVLFPARPDETPDVSSAVSLIVHHPGYVRLAAAPAQSGSPPAAEISSPAGDMRVPAPLPAFTQQITFQPFPLRFAAQLDEAPPYRVAAGDTVGVRFLGGAENQALNSFASGVFDTVTVLAAQADEASRSWILSLEMTEAQALKILEQRMSVAQFSDTPALPTHIALEFGLKPSSGTGQAMRLPATALSRQGDQSRVWLALDGAAVAVTVKELQRLDNAVLLTEVAGARGLPIAPEDWRAMGAALRRESLRAAAIATPGGGGNKLLTPSAAVIAQPDAALQPATAVKVRHD